MAHPIWSKISSFSTVLKNECQIGERRKSVTSKFTNFNLRVVSSKATTNVIIPVIIGIKIHYTDMCFDSLFLPSTFHWSYSWRYQMLAECQVCQLRHHRTVNNFLSSIFLIPQYQFLLFYTITRLNYSINDLCIST